MRIFSQVRRVIQQISKVQVDHLLLEGQPLSKAKVREELKGLEVAKDRVVVTGRIEVVIQELQVKTQIEL